MPLGRVLSGLADLLANRRWPLVAAVLSVLVLAGEIGAGWQLDDHFQRYVLLGHGDKPSIQLFVFYEGDPETHRRWMDVGSEPWWTAENMRHAPLRYLSVVTMQLDYLLWPELPSLMHLHSLLWLAGLVFATALFYRRILGATWAAGLAALMFALDDAHAHPAVYIANRNALIAGLFGVLCLACFDRWRRDGWRPGATLSPAFLALALAAGEIALGAAAYLFAHALFLGRGSLLKRARALLPNGAVLVLWALVYKLGNFGAGASGFYQSPLEAPLAYLGVLAQRMPVLILGQWTIVPADLGSIAPLTSSEGLPFLVMGLVVVAALFGLFWPILRRDAVARFWCLGALLSLVPIAATPPQNRLLIFVGLGSMALLGQLVSGLITNLPRVPATRWWRAPAWALAAALLVSHVLLAPPLAWLMLGSQARATAHMEQALASVPHDAAITEQDLILVNPPDQVYLVAAIRPFKQLRSQPVARRMRTLATGASTMGITRIDATTLEVALPAGLFPTNFSRYFRSPDVPFAVGDRVELSSFTAEIASLDESGDPNVVRYHFDVPLEDSTLRWLRFSDRAYVDWQPPGVGESVEVSPGLGMWD